jgi:hypothetical protein
VLPPAQGANVLDLTSQVALYDGLTPLGEEAVRAALRSAPIVQAALACGTVAPCASVLWQSFDEAGNALAAAQGSDPFGWHSDATSERIHFAGSLADTMWWTNRPTFQQVISFRSHR